MAKNGRFKIPKEIQEESTLSKDEKGNWVNTPARNDEKLYQYNSFIAQTWRANTDFQVITSEYAVICYVAKYSSKSEPVSKSLKEMFEEVVQSKNDDEESRQAYMSLMIKIIGERDIGACKTCHILSSSPLYHATRTFQVLCIKLQDYVAVRETDEFYQSRPQQMENMTLFEFTKKHSKGKNNSVSTNRKEKIVLIYPKIDKVIDSNVEIFCNKQQLMLHLPWRCDENLKNENETWKNAYDRSNLIAPENLNMYLLTPEEYETDNNNQ